MENVKYGKRPLYHPKKIYAFADLHGEFNCFQNLLLKIQTRLEDGDHIVGVGDYINKIGKKTPQLLMKLLELKRANPDQFHFIEGNHEQMLKDYLRGWPGMMEKYGADALRQFQWYWKMPVMNKEVLKLELEKRGLYEFLFKDLIPYYETDDVLITHAPIDLTTALIHGIEDYNNDYAEKEVGFRYFLERLDFDIRWTFTEEGKDVPWINKFRICGHQFALHTEPRIFENRAFIDVGCGARQNREAIAICFPTKEIIRSDKNDTI